MDAPGDSVRDEKAPSAGKSRRALAAHVAPYLLWILPLVFSAIVPSARIYAAKSLLCALLIAWLKPWRYYGRDEARPSQASDFSQSTRGRDEARPSRASDSAQGTCGRDEARPSRASDLAQGTSGCDEARPSRASDLAQGIRGRDEARPSRASDLAQSARGRDEARPSRGSLFGVLAGLVVAALWIFPETPWLFERAPGFVSFYNRWLIMPPGEFPCYFNPDIFPALPERHPSLAYAPWVCGWALTICKLLGSAFVISVAEEYFFRGFLYRWLRKGDFLSIDPSRYDAQTFWLVVLVFGLEHDRWLAGMMAGAVYGWIVLRTGRLGPAIVAHATTNLALGVYVILSRQYGFW